MAKIYQRPDPPPPDVDSNRAVRKTDTYLNNVASAGLFQKALVKAQGQEQAVEQSKLTGSGQQDQIESDADSALGAKGAESLRALHGEKNASAMNSEPNTLQTADVVEPATDMAELAADEAELEAKSDDLIDVDSADQAEQDTDLAGSPTGPDSTAAYQMFENIQQQNSSAEPEPHGEANTKYEGVNNQQDASVTAQSAVAHSAASTAASLESRIDSMSSMSDLIDMLETSSQLTEGNEWTLLLEDDGPVSELTLSSDAEGRWNIDLRTSFDNEAVDDNMISNLRHQLDTAGIAVGNIGLVDTAPVESTSAKQVKAMDSGTNNVA